MNRMHPSAERAVGRKSRRAVDFSFPHHFAAPRFSPYRALGLPPRPRDYGATGRFGAATPSCTFTFS